jgi:hypothetical protein
MGNGSNRNLLTTNPMRTTDPKGPYRLDSEPASGV